MQRIVFRHAQRAVGGVAALFGVGAEGAAGRRRMGGRQCGRKSRVRKREHGCRNRARERKFRPKDRTQERRRRCESRARRQKHGRGGRGRKRKRRRESRARRRERKGRYRARKRRRRGRSRARERKREDEGDAQERKRKHGRAGRRAKAARGRRRENPAVGACATCAFRTRPRMRKPALRGVFGKGAGRHRLGVPHGRRLRRAGEGRAVEAGPRRWGRPRQPGRRLYPLASPKLRRAGGIGCRGAQRRGGVGCRNTRRRPRSGRSAADAPLRSGSFVRVPASHPAAALARRGAGGIGGEGAAGRVRHRVALALLGESPVGTQSRGHT